MPKKKKPNSPRRFNYKRPERLAAAKEWIKTYTNKKVHQGYATYFGVNKLCAVDELKMIGHPVPEEIEAAIRKTFIATSNTKKPKEKSEEFSEEEYWGFSCIAGYTSGGIPYGTTLEELEMPDNEESNFSDHTTFKIFKENITEEKEPRKNKLEEKGYDLPF